MGGNIEVRYGEVEKKTITASKEELKRIMQMPINKIDNPELLYKAICARAIEDIMKAKKPLVINNDMYEAIKVASKGMYSQYYAKNMSPPLADFDKQDDAIKAVFNLYAMKDVENKIYTINDRISEGIQAAKLGERPVKVAAAKVETKPAQAPLSQQIAKESKDFAGRQAEGIEKWAINIKRQKKMLEELK